MQMEFQDPIKGSSSSPASSAFPSAPQQDYYGAAGNNFNYQQQQQQQSQPTMGIPVNVMHNSSHQQWHQQPPITAPVITAPVRWSTGLCGCCDDCSSCCLTCWCPCITFGRIAEITDKGSIWCALSGTLYTILLATGCSFLYSCCYRSKLRAQYSLEESPCLDCCVHLCCQSCALCQEYRELQKRGIDLSIGWQKNMERQIRGASVHPPIVQQPMHTHNPVRYS